MIARSCDTSHLQPSRRRPLHSCRSTVVERLGRPQLTHTPTPTIARAAWRRTGRRAVDRRARRAGGGRARLGNPRPAPPDLLGFVAYPEGVGTRARRGAPSGWSNTKGSRLRPSPSGVAANEPPLRCPQAGSEPLLRGALMSRRACLPRLLGGGRDDPTPSDPRTPSALNSASTSRTTSPATASSARAGRRAAGRGGGSGGMPRW